MTAMSSAPRWRKSPPELVALFDAVLSGEPRAERRQMFGYPAAFVNGNMATGLHQDDWMLRLGEKDRAALTAQGGRPFEPMPGRPMREYVVLPKGLLRERRALAGWIRRGIDYGAASQEGEAEEREAEPHAQEVAAAAPSGPLPHVFEHNRSLRDGKGVHDFERR